MIVNLWFWESDYGWNLWWWRMLYLPIYIYTHTWSNYSDLTRPHPKWWFSKGNPLISGKPRLVKYYNLARSTVRRLQSQPWGLLIFYWDRWCFWVTWIPYFFYFAVQLDEYLTIPKTLFGVIHRIHVWYPPGNNGWVEKAFAKSEKLGRKLVGILVETFTNMGNKEPNSTCFIARFLKHQLGVAMGVMIPSSQQKTSFWHQDGQFDSPFATVKVLQSVCFPIPFRRIIIERHDSGWILQRGPLRGISGWNTPISTVYPFIFGHF